MNKKNTLSRYIRERSLQKLVIGTISVSMVTMALVSAMYIHRVENRVSVWLLILILLLISSCIVAILLKLWLEKPVRNFMTDAYEIGRGNFSNLLPQQNEETLQRLAKLINYMASEMDRLRKVNVHSIISEKNKTEALLRNIADGVIVTDMNTNVLVMNQTAEKWFGISEREALGKPLKNSFRNTDMFMAFEKAIHETHDFTIEFAYQIMDTAVPHILQAHTSRVDDENGHPIGCIAVLRDVTKERDADRVKTELVSMVAHELKSPLTSIFGFSELLTQADHVDLQFKEYARVIMAESTRLTDFVNKFLNLSRLESGHTEVKMIPFDLQQVILHMTQLQKYNIDSKHIRLITDFPDQMPLAVGDQELIEQVLINLFVNAVKYSQDRSKIGIEVKNETDQFLVHVIDNGTGIPKSALPNIFNKFYRVLNEAREEEIEGSGLGLALVKEIIERHGGTIRVQSRPGVGSIFSFTVPIYKN